MKRFLIFTAHCRQGLWALLVMGFFWNAIPVMAQRSNSKQKQTTAKKKKNKAPKTKHQKKKKHVAAKSTALAADPLFLATQLQFPRVAKAHEKYGDSLLHNLTSKGLNPNAFELYLRSFKYDSELEVWGRNTPTDTFCLLKTFSVCALSGELGHKRAEGDYQVPEGFYHLTQFKPKSKYHLSIGINYPNAADRHWTDSLHPGGEIFIHGTCTTVGCIPIRNGAMEELYLLAAMAKNNGQLFVPIHIFPARFGKASNKPILEKAFARDPLYKQLTQPLIQVYDLFQANHRLPVVGITATGEYLVLAPASPSQKP